MITLPATGYVGLSVGGVEVAGNAYERQAVLFTNTVDGISVANLDGIVWPLAYPYGWGLISTVQLYDASGPLAWWWHLGRRWARPTACAATGGGAMRASRRCSPGWI